MPEQLFLGKEDYHGFLRARLEVPGGQVWVFQRHNRPPVSVWSRDEEGSKPPAAPWLERSAMRIFKFRRTIRLPYTISLFETSAPFIRLSLLVTINLIDPVSYMESGQFETDSSHIFESALLLALRSVLSLERQKRFDSQVVPITLRDLTSPAFRHLFTDADLSRYIQDHPDFRKLGVRVRVVVGEAEVSLIYNELVDRMRTELQKELLEVKRRLIAVKGDDSFLEGNLSFRERLYTGIAGYYEEIQPGVVLMLNTLFEQAGKVAQKALDPILAAVIFKDLVCQQIDEIAQVTDAGIMDPQASTEQMLSSQENVRDMHIEALYKAAIDENWRISPPRNKVDEVILIDAGNNLKIELQVPNGYPKDRPVVKVRLNNAPIRQSDVNRIVQPITSRSTFDLIVIVRALANNTSQPVVEEEKSSMN